MEREPYAAGPNRALDVRRIQPGSDLLGGDAGQPHRHHGRVRHVHPQAHAEVVGQRDVMRTDRRGTDIDQELEGAEGLETVALVGHEPWLGSLASLLLTGEPHRVSIDFPKSGVMGIETDAI